MKIRIIVIGKLKEAYWRAASDEYLKRLSAYADFSVLELDELPTPEKASEIEKERIKNSEGEKILAKVRSNDFICTLDLGKKEPTSLELSSLLDECLVRSGSNLTFVIGGSLGLGENIKKRANASFSLSKLTFTHQMSRVILLEQLYRSFRILHHEPYDK